jgi:putative hydrolase
VDPVEALRRIAYVLETTGAETYKVKAFRTAAETLAALPASQIEELARTRRLTSLPGIGKTTAEVVMQAVDGKTPSYLESIDTDIDLQAPVSERALEIKALLRGDCHSHSNWSDGGSPIEEMALAARNLGHEYLVLTDHSPRLTVARGLSRERLLEQLSVVERVNEELAPFRLLTGIEVDILEDGSLDQDEELLAGLDVVVASVHSKLAMEPAAMTERMLAAIENPHTDILGHCTGRIIVGKGRPGSRFDHEAVFDACARTGTAVEINSRPERRDPPHELLVAAVNAGCYLSIDTDAHAPGQLEWLTNGCQQAADANVDPAMVVNTLPVELLLEWARSHARV